MGDCIGYVKDVISWYKEDSDLMKWVERTQLAMVLIPLAGEDDEEEGSQGIGSNEENYDNDHAFDGKNEISSSLNDSDRSDLPSTDGAYSNKKNKENSVDYLKGFSNLISNTLEQMLESSDEENGDEKDINQIQSKTESNEKGRSFSSENQSQYVRKTRRK